MAKNDRQSGFIVTILIILAIMIVGYLIISRLLQSDSAQDVQQTTTDIIDDAKQNVDRANQATDKAGEIIDNASGLIEE